MVGKVRDRETVLTDHAAQLVFLHHRVSLECQRMVRVELRGETVLDEPENGENRQRRAGAHGGGEVNPIPSKMPIAAVTQMDAAVVNPRTVSPSLKMTPAPRKPIPVMIPCAIRVGSVRMASRGTTVIHWFW